jgi:hypothetical protein
MSRHDHAEACQHTVAYCAQCTVAYCTVCGAQWVPAPLPGLVETTPARAYGHQNAFSAPESPDSEVDSHAHAEAAEKPAQ